MIEPGRPLAKSLDYNGRVLPFIRQNWFLIALAALFALGFCGHARLKPLADAASIRTYTVAIAMFLMALPLHGSAIWDSLRRPWATLLAVGVTFGLLPLIAWGASFGLSPELKGGLLVAAVTPCTMASATVWVRFLVSSFCATLSRC